MKGKEKKITSNTVARFTLFGIRFVIVYEVNRWTLNTSRTIRFMWDIRKDGRYAK